MVNKSLKLLDAASLAKRHSEIIFKQYGYTEEFDRSSAEYLNS